ncbi:SHOCT domain-containing protein [[Mycobacterium] nativiensis]|uniref:SHOCT domain-containing protein n=1 Tax=[Mycobacterium] nativiensis TaxID=2855503 RepID=A0ABU5XW38_9MYCO|nr:SHOCT domain-containing protein [Mycolicibacter sp. MYC340]MEB3031962.1 SHOCT domain-containing protein [Mycolicibacter sp. MYC340]
MLWRYVKAQVMVLGFGGLVGPIFLGVYFAVGPQAELKWMFYTGLLITFLDVLAALWLTDYGAKSAAKNQFLEQQGVLALAQVVGIHETGTRINDQPLVKLDLHIEGAGLAPFDTQDRVIASVTRMPLISGRKLAVLVDPGTNSHQIDWQRSALLSGTVPAQFTLAEDSATYDLAGQSGPLMEIFQILRANGIPVQGAIDIRSNPVVRQQVAAVVRRAAEQHAGAAGHDAPEQRSAGERLQELEALRRSGAVTDEEYAQKRQQIIADL